jgi:hypothetical protein
MTSAQGDVLVLIVFASLLVLINIKSSGGYWSARLLRIASYVLLLFTLAETAYLIYGLVR